MKKRSVIYKDRRWLCVIPARAGSSGVKDKNIRVVHGKPLIQWAIDAAKDSGIFDTIAVSTDGKKIAKVAEEQGVEVWNRPKELAQNDSHVMDAMQWHLQNEERSWDMVQMLHATNPLVTGVHILKAAKFAVRKNAEFVISVCKSDVPLGVARPIPENWNLKGWFPKELRQLNRQQIPQTYQLDGNIYLGKYSVFLHNVDYWETDIYAYEMPRSKYCDIDDETDLKVAAMELEAMYGTTRPFWSGLRKRR